MAMRKKTPDWPDILGQLTAKADIYEEAETGCDDEEIAEVEEHIGRPLPEPVAACLRVSDGARLHLRHQVIHLASRTQLEAWHAEGAIDDLGAFPFAHDGDDHLLVLDTDGEWGGERGSVYRLQLSQRFIHGRLIHGALPLSQNMSGLFNMVMKGRDLW